MKLLLVVTVIINLFGQEKKSLDQIILFHTYNSDYAIADSLIDEQIKRDPTHPKYHFFRSAIFFLKAGYQVNETERDSLINLAIVAAEEAVDLAEDREMTTENKFYLGAAHGYLGRAHGMQRSYFSALKHGRKGKELLEEVVEEDPEYWDAYLGLGIFNYYVDKLGSGILRPVVWILGMSGDREKGLRYLKLARDKGKLAFAEATAVLGTIYYSMEHDYHKARYYADSFNKTYPNNKAFWIYYYRLLDTMNDYKTLEKMIASDNNNLIPEYRKAQYYNSIGNYKKSNDYCLLVLNNQSDFRNWQIREVQSLYSFNNWILGDRKEMLKYEADLTERDRNVKTFETYKTIDPSQAEVTKIYQLRAAVNEFKDHDKINALLAMQVPAEPPFLNELYHLYKGIYEYKQGQLDEAKITFNQLLKLNGERWNALFYLIDIYEKQKTSEEEIENLLEQVDELDSEWLSRKAERLEVKLDKM
ncbi:MAG: hypothetical protein KDD94_01100 [Calditrichaeota bacterium]|nr:hypothetical protein [Calditrichota bacterium]